MSTLGGTPPPVVAAPTILSFSTDSGVTGDGITNDNTLTLTGTAQANSTVKVYDGTTLLGADRSPMVLAPGALRRPFLRMVVTI